MQNKRKITGYIVVTAPFTSGENWIIEKRCTTRRITTTIKPHVI